MFFLAIVAVDVAVAVFLIFLIVLPDDANLFFCFFALSFIHIFVNLIKHLRANAQKYREKRGHGQNLTNLHFKFIER